MELIARLLLVAFRHSIKEPNRENGLVRVAMIAGPDIDPNALHAVLDRALADGYIHDPVQLLPGALQCHWHLELTPQGVDQVLGLLLKHGKTAELLLADTTDDP
ncbi:hypothetical protein [Rhodopila sp.]|uniref:hypothetical protein n=1 Tax=Rhodopila sp. TaxID=2480087 RepID=UPI003D13231B